jgi:hypothetical protein
MSTSTFEATNENGWGPRLWANGSRPHGNPHARSVLACASVFSHPPLRATFRSFCLWVTAALEDPLYPESSPCLGMLCALSSGPTAGYMCGLPESLLTRTPHRGRFCAAPHTKAQWSDDPILLRGGCTARPSTGRLDTTEIVCTSLHYRFDG